jgi:type VI secretion system secreted protein VgrG
VSKNIHARLTSPHLDTSGMQVRSVVGREAISKPYRFDIEVICVDTEIIVSETIGLDLALVFEEDGTEVRAVRGMIVEIVDTLRVDDDFRVYHLELVPYAARLAVVETQEVFLDLSVPDIVRQKLAMVGIDASLVDVRLSGNYAPRELVVEYKETDLAFISRLTEHLGISYFFESANDSEKIVFTDSSAGFAPLPGNDEVAFRSRGEGLDVYRLEQRTRMIPAVYVMQDYNYRTPRVDLTASYESATGNAGGMVEYGGHHRTPSEGMALAQVRSEEREARFQYFEGEASNCRFSAGATFRLTDHPRLAEVRLLLVEVEHRLTQPTTHEKAQDTPRYQCSFKAVDAQKAYRPPLTTPKPRISGVLTATIEHELGESPGMGRIARIDEHGRYLVRFHFDTGSSKRKRCSSPIRMMQPHVGPNYGMHFPLKPDSEVIISFVDGDPDRPVIAGAVPNPLTASPVNRQNAMMHTIQTASGVSILMKDTP